MSVIVPVLIVRGRTLVLPKAATTTMAKVSASKAATAAAVRMARFTGRSFQASPDPAFLQSTLS